jgi:proteasome alpha subunit
MSMPGMYVSPEQLMQDRADYARKGIARGRALVLTEYDNGIAIVAENASATLRKVSEVYDRIAFGGVGRYNEFDQLRIAGVRHAELKGFQYSREDVDARSLANQYAQMLGQIFTHEMKPMEVEIVVAELGTASIPNELYRIQYDGTVVDVQEYSVIGGDSEAVLGRLADGYSATMSRTEVIKLSGTALSGPDRELGASDLEVAVLEEDNGRRTFRRLSDEQVAAALEA